MAIRALCDSCGEVRLDDPRQITVRICIDNRRATYRFQCPDCMKTAVKPLHPSILQALLRYDVNLEQFWLPSELNDAERSDARPFTADDVLDFHLELEWMP